MLLLCSSLKQLDFSKLKNVYLESIQSDGKNKYPDKPDNLQWIEAEQDFYQFLQDFFQMNDARYFVWAPDGQYKAALRVEPYRDGLLIEGLETAPDSRRKGYAGQLMTATIKILIEQYSVKLYSHIHKRNFASIRTHLSCGFTKESDFAVFIDGSVDHNYNTYIKNAVPN